MDALEFLRERKNFNPRAPRGARLASKTQAEAILEISIHAPREGRDRCLLILVSRLFYFNPRAPRGARRLIFLRL